MRKKVLTAVLSAMLLTFAGTAAITVASAKPGCDRCRKDGCPSGFCYVDCVGCCYNDAQLGVVCFR